MVGFGSPHRHLAATDSTNTRAREMAEAGAPHGTVVTAGEQSAGRGRQGRSWTAPAGKALLHSAIARPLDERHMLLPLAVPIAVCAAAEELAPGIECAIKWPNDVWLERRKLAGILVEARPGEGWAVIGVGLNLTISRDEFPPELRDTAISLFGSSKGGPGVGRGSLPAVAPPTHPRTPLLAAKTLNRHLDRWVTADPDAILSEWRARDALRGREISWDGGSGVVDGIDEAGRLVVVSGGERVSLGAGEVHLRL
jgi:BirA family transcriptional regulator, biotin operon repressor / biotin---[acetyl-CoA-carboxylase] ligase